MNKSKKQEIMDMLHVIDPDGDFEGLMPVPNHTFDGAIHSVLELSTGEVFMSQGETETEEGFIVAIDRKGRYEELKPGEYEVVEVLSWDPDTDELEVVPYTEEE
jgi:hypothetical protein